MDLKHLVMLALQVSILCTVFGFGLKATLDDVLHVVRRPALFARSLLAVFVIMPIVAVALARVFDVRPAVEIALVALALSPVPPLLPQRETKAGGHKGYAIGLMATLSALAIVIVPLALAGLGLVFGQTFGMAPVEVAKIVLPSTLLPLLAGVLVRAAFPAFADRIEEPVSLVAKVLLPVAAIALLVAVAPAMWVLIGNGTLLAMMVLAVVGFAVGHVLGGPDPAYSTVLAFSSACRHPALAFSMASTAFPDQQFGGAILLYFIVSGLIGAAYAVLQRQQFARPVSS
jgi:bile acid:Na+ symporter, BASS family